MTKKALQDRIFAFNARFTNVRCAPPNPATVASSGKNCMVFALNQASHNLLATAATKSSIYLLPACLDISHSPGLRFPENSTCSRNLSLFLEVASCYEKVLSHF